MPNNKLRSAYLDLDGTTPTLYRDIGLILVVGYYFFW